MARGQMMFLLVVVLVLLLPPISLSQSAQAGRARCRNKGGDCVADSEVTRGARGRREDIINMIISGPVSALQKQPGVQAGEMVPPQEESPMFCENILSSLLGLRNINKYF